MFGRRRRATSNPAFNHGPPASSPATTAAAQAFLKAQPSTSSLSAAAAAAALRSRPTTPIDVANVQTKRMLQRTASNSSRGSSQGGSVRGNGSRPQLGRRGSSGSMTERTFRDPSPNRGSSWPDVDHDAPPVPAIPKNLPRSAVPQIPAKSHRRTASMETPITRVASPPPNAATGRGSSLGPTTSGGYQPQRKPAGQKLARVQELTDVERPASRGSVNFSYPTNNRAMSPYGQRQLTSPTPQRANQNSNFQKPNLVYDPNTRTFRPEAELLFYEQKLRDTANPSPTHRKKKAAATQPLAGSHLADGTVGGRIKGTAVEAAKPPQAPEPEPVTTTPAATPRKKKVTVSQQSSDIDSYASTGTSDGESDASERPKTFNTRTGMLLAKKPSVVREDREREEAEDDATVVKGRREALTRLETGTPETRTVSPTPRVVAGRGHGRGLAAASAGYAQSRQQTRSASMPAQSLMESASTEFPSVEGRGTGSVRGSRVQSVSPARSAHFMQSPESLAVRHEPPARAVSPRKSALKQSASPRGGSPAPDNVSRGPGSTLSEVSDTSTALSDDKLTPTPKKKSVRVSFDDENTVVVGTAAGQLQTDSPIVQSPQTKKSWFSSIGRGKKKELSNFDDQDDEMMKPRPALPSFGSVREKKTRDVEDRPLVMPNDSVDVHPSPPLLASPSGEHVEPLGLSNDHLVGAVLSQEQASRNEANISKSREPLPPQVTSVEGSGYVSDSSSTFSLNADPFAHERAKNVKTSLEDDDANSDSAIATPVPEVQREHTIQTEKTNGNGNISTSSAIQATPIPEQVANAQLMKEQSEERDPELEDSKDIPTFNITQPTPTMEETETMESWPTMPGGFPQPSSESSQEESQVSLVESHPPLIEHQPTDLTPSALGIAEPDPIHHEVGEPVVGEIASQNLHHIHEETEESEHDSIYSDAAEDLSDLEGDGFMSLDAVVESPISKNPPFSLMNPPDSPTSAHVKQKVYKKSKLSRKSSEPEMDEGWDKAQEYWSSLTADKKRELELAAIQDTDESEVEIEPAPKPMKKKKATTKPPVQQYEETQNTRRQEVVNNRSYQIAPGSKAGPDGIPTMRSSMRATPKQAPEETHMRTSMRSAGSVGGGRTMRGSMRGSSESSAPLQPKASLQKKYRPISSPPPESKPDPIEVKKHIRNMSANPAFASQTMKPAPKMASLRRSGSVDSDKSDSSFRRARPTSEGYSMKRSMRGSVSSISQGRPQSPEMSISKNRSSRFSLRSLSPTGGFRRGFNSTPTGPPVTLPTTMRANRPDAPTIRVLGPQKKGGGGFGRSNPAPAARAPQKRPSRFADSSDEEEDTMPTFRSRFVDSSDDESEPAPAHRPMTTMRSGPVRSIPRRANVNDGDSSDLPDTEDEREEEKSPRTAASKPAVKIAQPASGTGSALASGSLRRSGSGRGAMGAPITTTTTITGGGGRPDHKRKGSFMSILRRKKDPGAKVHKSDAESPARRDTPLERSKSEVQAIKRSDMAPRRQDSNFSITSANGGVKLQKRQVPKRVLSGGSSIAGGDNWPLPVREDEEKDEEMRPSTADVYGKSGATNGNGNGFGVRPGVGDRRATATGLSSVDLTSMPGTPKKKKRFGVLRRAFRLDD